MTTVSTEEVQQNLPSILARLKSGESMVIEQNGEPVATLRSVAQASQTPKEKRVFGSLEGKIKVPDDFDEMMRDEIEEMFHGKL